MIRPAEIVYALHGISRLIRFDRGGLDYFDRSIQGFWRSFSVALLVAPFYALLIPAKLEAIKPTVGWAEVIAIEVLAYIVAWLLYPTVAYEICRRLGRQSEYPGFIAVYNWSSILFVGTQLVIRLPTVFGVASVGLAGWLNAIAIGFFQLYLWFVAREALKVNGITAVGLVAVDFVLWLLLANLERATLTP